jgi:hypothetical protein
LNERVFSLHAARVKLHMAAEVVRWVAAAQIEDVVPVKDVAALSKELNRLENLVWKALRKDPHGS